MFVLKKDLAKNELRIPGSGMSRNGPEERLVRQGCQDGFPVSSSPGSEQKNTPENGASSGVEFLNFYVKNYSNLG